MYRRILVTPALVIGVLCAGAAREARCQSAAIELVELKAPMRDASDSKASETRERLVSAATQTRALRDATRNGMKAQWERQAHGRPTPGRHRVGATGSARFQSEVAEHRQERRGSGVAGVKTNGNGKAPR